MAVVRRNGQKSLLDRITISWNTQILHSTTGLNMEITSFIISIISGVVALFTFIFSVCTHYRAIAHARKQATLDAFNRLQNEAFDPLNLYSPAEIREIVKHPTSEKYKIIGGYVARIEHFCVGVENKIYDRKTVYQLAHEYLDKGTIWERMSIIIEAKQKKSGDGEVYSVIFRVRKSMKKSRRK